MSLKQNDKKIKLFWSGLFILVIALCGLMVWQVIGIDTRYNATKLAISIEKSTTTSSELSLTNKIDKKGFYIAASKSGTKYYYQNCAGLGRIKPENLTYFISEGQAEGAGYSLAKNCKKP